MITTKEEFRVAFLKYLPFEPTLGQRAAIDKLSEFIFSSSETVFILKGYAGTGKTSLVAAMVQALKQTKLTPDLLAPTGRAAKVLSQYAKKTAFTIHRRIYKPKSAYNLYGGFVLAPNRKPNKVFIVDEASMINTAKQDGTSFGSGNLLQDLLDFVHSGVRSKLIVIGDHAQLPPVGMSYSPALEPATYEELGYNVVVATLTEVVRQAEQSGILHNATLLRNYLKAGEVYAPPQFNVADFDDIERISGAELTEALNHSYETAGIENTLVITRSNKMANRYNAGIRQSILFREERLSVDDLLMVVKNNYFWLSKGLNFIANGDLVKVTSIYSYREIYNRSFAKVALNFPDYGTDIDAWIMLDVLDLETASLPYEESKEFFNLVMEDYVDQQPRTRYRKVKTNEFFNALQVKFAYAVTCHKAQGGQWHTVFIDQTYFDNSMIDRDYFRWLYTAITRATDKVYLVNFSDDFFA